MPSAAKVVLPLSAGDMCLEFVSNGFARVGLAQLTLKACVTPKFFVAISGNLVAILRTFGLAPDLCRNFPGSVTDIVVAGLWPRDPCVEAA